LQAELQTKDQLSATPPSLRLTRPEARINPRGPETPRLFLDRGKAVYSPPSAAMERNG